jgi:hypothetical protein
MSDLSEAQANLALVKSAYSKALLGIEVRYGDMVIRRNNIDILRKELAYWQGQVNILLALEAGATNPGVMTPRWT